MIEDLAHRLWESHGGNAILNWLEAEQLLGRLRACSTSALAPEARFCELSARGG